MQIKFTNTVQRSQKQVENLRTHFAEHTVVKESRHCCHVVSVLVCTFQVFLSRYCRWHLVRDFIRKFLFLYVHNTPQQDPVCAHSTCRYLLLRFSC